MLIVDSQVHIWAASTPERSWSARFEPHRPVPLGSEDLLREMNAAGIDRTVIVPAGWEGDRNDLGLEAARVHPSRFALMGRIDVESPASRGLMATWRQQPGMLGLRLTFRRGMFRRLLAEGLTDWLWAEAEQAGVPIMIMVDYDQVPQIDRIAQRYPGLKLVMDHLCLDSDKKDDAAFVGLDKLLAMAMRPNVAVKVSALPCYSTDRYPYKSLHGYIRKVYDTFGPKRMFWGSDLSRSPIPYRQHVTLFTEELPWLTTEDKEWIMGRALCAWIGWK